MLHSLLLLCALAAPFEDVHKRFTLETPEDWQFAPQPGDTGGATFQSKRKDLLAITSIRVTQARGLTLAEYVRRVGNALVKEPGYKVMAEEPDVLAGLPAVRRQYVINVDKQGKLKKLVEQRVMVNGDRGYVVHCETLADSYSAFEADFRVFFTSFKPTDADAVSAKVQLSRSPLVGEWRSATDASSVLVLRPDGTFLLGEARGAFRIEGKRLVTLLEGGGAETFAWELVEGDLVLSSPGLDAPMRYRRAPKF